MNRFILHIAFLLSAFSPKAQNLIYNGSFEEYYSCPTGNDLNDGQLEKAKGWWKPTWGSSDYFNRCSVWTVGVPNNFWGYQEAYSGDAYIGFSMAEWNIATGTYVASEYVQSKLLKTLKPCYEYNLTMYVSLANESQYAVGKIGALFSHDTVGINNDNTELFIGQASTTFHNAEPIADTSGWSKIELNFVAQEYEQYITIGYFFPNVTDDTTFIQDFQISTFASYYYLDNVSVVEIGKVSGSSCRSEKVPFPNVMTADNDGVNDLIDISGLLEIVSEVRILNRWGNTVAVLDEGQTVWDGGECVDGIYFYLIEFPEDRGIEQQTGLIHLLR